MLKEPEFSPKENPCPECGSVYLDVEQTLHGWLVVCLDCGHVEEYDIEETPAEHRSV